MKQIIFFWASVYSVLCSQSILPDAVIKKSPGRYDVNVTITNASYAINEPVRAFLYIPPFSNGMASSDRPLIVFYHGSTRDKTFYKTSVQQMIQKADQDQFTLLSVQNWWMLSGDHTEATDDSRRAANTIINSLIQNGVVRADAVYACGFSAGGFTALVTVLNSIDDPMMHEQLIQSGSFSEEVCNYAGLASFKGNFYENVVRIAIPVGQETFSYPDYYQKIFPDKLVFLTVGGKQDAARVIEQAPRARDFLKDYLGLPVMYLEFPNEGHSLTDANWKAFWDNVKKRLKP